MFIPMYTPAQGRSLTIFTKLKLGRFDIFPSICMYYKLYTICARLILFNMKHAILKFKYDIFSGIFGVEIELPHSRVYELFRIKIGPNFKGNRK